MRISVWKHGPWFGEPTRMKLASAVHAKLAADERAQRYFRTAASYTRAAAELGYGSLEAAVRDGKMPDIIRAAAATGDPNPPGGAV